MHAMCKNQSRISNIRQRVTTFTFTTYNVRWGIDFAGPLPTSKRGNKYILVCIEHMKKWVELIALPPKSSAHVARAFLENILNRFGVPRVVLTDQGIEFQGEF